MLDGVDIQHTLCEISTDYMDDGCVSRLGDDCLCIVFGCKDWSRASSI